MPPLDTQVNNIHKENCNLILLVILAACAASFIYIPNLSPDGIKSLPVPAATQEYYSTLCGGAIAIDGKAIPLALICMLGADIR
jgi:hypothetical protein